MGKAEISAQNQPARRARRRNIAWSLEGTANMLEQVLEGNYKSILKDHDDYLHDKEYRIIMRAKKYTKWQIKAMRAVAKVLHAS